MHQHLNLAQIAIACGNYFANDSLFPFPFFKNCFKRPVNYRKPSYKTFTSLIGLIQFPRLNVFVLLFDFTNL